MSGKIKVVITDEQKEVRIPKGLRMLIRRSCIAALQNQGVEGDIRVNVVFVDNSQIAELNQKHFGKSEVVTNLVLSDDTDENCIGSIIISVQKALEQADVQAISLERVTGSIVVHGVLHLTSGLPQTDLEETRLKETEDYIMYLLGLPVSSAYALNNA